MQNLNRKYKKKIAKEIIILFLGILIIGLIYGYLEIRNNFQYSEHEELAEKVRQQYAMITELKEHSTDNNNLKEIKKKEDEMHATEMLRREIRDRIKTFSNNRYEIIKYEAIILFIILYICRPLIMSLIWAIKTLKEK